MKTEQNVIPLARPEIGEAELNAIQRPLAAGWLTQGPEVAAFEQEFAAFVGAPHACAVSNCTTALHLALRAVGVGPGDEVITVSHSFIATANAIRYCGGVPVFVDVRPDTYNIDPAGIVPVISARTRAVLVVHQLGMPCELQPVIETANQYGLPVIEDAACAAGSEILWNGRWERIGRPHGDIACFSFHPRKVITTGEGGMLTTANPRWDLQFRRWRQHSMSVPDTTRHTARQVVIEQYPELGFNYRMTDMQAAVGLVQLGRLGDLIERRQEQGTRYDRAFAKHPALAIPQVPPGVRFNYQTYLLRLLPGARVSRETLMQRLLEQGIATRRGVMAAHREPAYRRRRLRVPLPATDEADRAAIVLPLHHTLALADQDRVIEAVLALV
jgi:dTDP-4-amino-4,6-dideoxygalactose transaminase